MKLNFITFTIISFLLVSCDPAQTIELNSQLESNSLVKFYFNGHKHFKFDEFVTEDSLILELGPNKNKVFDFGIGTWEIHHSLDTLTSCIDKIEITSEKSTQLFVTTSQVRSFFEDRLIDDRYKARIIIDIN